MECERPLSKGLTWMEPDLVEAITIPLAQVEERLPRVMAEIGVAVISDVVAGAELDELVSAWQADLESVVDVSERERWPESVESAYVRFLAEGPRAFPLKTTKDFTFGAGFAVDRCLCHGGFSWRVRRHPNVHRAFRVLHGDEPLVTSVDVPFFTPQDVGRGPAPPFNSAHVDQNRHDVRGNLGSKLEYQGVLYAWPCVQGDESTATVVWPRSHIEGGADGSGEDALADSPYDVLMRDASAIATGNCGSHYTDMASIRNWDVSARLKARFEVEARRVPVPAGGLLLWNSRTVHTGAKRGPRLAQAVCLEPCSRRSPEERLAKLRLAALGLPSMHWASHGVQHDCVRLEWGVMTRDSNISAQGAAKFEEVGLPLKSCITPLGLAEGVLDPDALWTLPLFELPFSEDWKDKLKQGLDTLDLALTASTLRVIDCSGCLVNMLVDGNTPDAERFPFSVHWLCNRHAALIALVHNSADSVQLARVLESCVKDEVKEFL